MSFWKTMPVAVHATKQPNTFTKIVDEQFLLDKINRELDNPHVDFKYDIYENDDLDDVFIQKMKAFYDEQYSYDSNVCLTFKQDVYKFFLLDALVVKFYVPDTKEIIGYIVGKKIKLNINSKSIDTLEVSFFCIHKKFRNRHFTPYFINVILKQFIIRYNISVSTYALSDNIRSPYYTVKYLIHRPINTEHLKKCEFIPKELNCDEYKIFEKNLNVDLVYLNNTDVPDNLLQILHKKLNTFQHRHFTVYREISKEDIKQLLKNKNFHNFVIFNKDKTIKDFVSFYDLQLNITERNLMYNSSSIYTMFFEKYDTANIRSTLEIISEYCHKYNIIDVLSFFDIFPVNDYSDIKCLNGQGSLYYYLFNYNMMPLSNDKISYVTI
jgi:hypothetical protein